VFQHEYGAEKFLEQLREQLAPGRTGTERRQDPADPVRAFRPADRDERGEGKPESFTFLGFTHICAENSLGRFEVRRITAGLRRRQKLQAIKQELRRRRHEPVAQVGGWLKSVLNGYYQYHAVPKKPDGAVTIPTTGRPLLVPCAGTGQPKAAHLGQAGWENDSITGYPFPKLFMHFPMRDSAPATLRRHIRSKNRVR
jgi:hypothetical protein